MSTSSTSQGPARMDATAADRPGRARHRACAPREPADRGQAGWTSWRRSTSQPTRNSPTAIAASKIMPPRVGRGAAKQQVLEQRACLGHREQPAERTHRCRELVEVEREPAEEDGREQDQQRHLDGLAIGVRQERHDRADADRRDDEEGEATQDHAGPPRNGTPNANTRMASTASATTVPRSVNAAYLPARISPLPTGEIRNRSSMPAAPVVEHRQGADGDDGVLDDQGQHHDPVERDDVRLAGGEVDHLCPRRGGGDLGRDR